MRVLLFVLLFASCNKAVVKPQTPFGEYTVKAGNHKFYPYEIGFTSGGSWVFDVSCNSNSSYVLPFPDSEDWNKMTGISWSLLSNTKRSTMLAFRDRSTASATEYSFYSHTQDGVVKDRGILTVPYGHTVRYSIKELQGNYISLRLEDIVTKNYIEDVILITGRGISKRYIGSYFGGTSPAPNDVTVYVFKL